MRCSLTLPLLTVLGACGDKDDTADTGHTHEHESDTDTDTDTDADTQENVIEGPDDAGVVRVAVDGTAAAVDWTYLDLEAPAFVSETAGWSLAARRYEVLVSGGVSGSGGVEVAWTDVAFEAVTAAPAAGWVTDTDDEKALGSWYDYDTSTHVLTPKAGTWLVRSAGAVTYALEFVSYYNDDGDAGYLQLRYRPLGSDSGEWEAVLDATDATAPLYLSLDGDTEVSGPSGLDWDLSVTRTVLRTNGGVSGEGAGAAYTWPDGTLWEAVTTAPSEGWQVDAEDDGRQSGAALSTWYDYDTTTHAVSPSGRIHAVRGADGGVWKLRVTSWDDGLIGVRVAPLAEAR